MRDLGNNLSDEWELALPDNLIELRPNAAGLVAGDRRLAGVFDQTVAHQYRTGVRPAIKGLGWCRDVWDLP